MASEIVLQALESIEFSRALEKDQREKIANISTYVTFSEGATIFREGDASELVYLIMEGEVLLTTQVPGHGQVIILTLGPGQLLGWSSLFLPQKKTAGARTTQATKAVAINATQLLELCQANSQLGYVIMWRVAEIISNRLRAARNQLLDMFEPVSESD